MTMDDVASISSEAEDDTSSPSSPSVMVGPVVVATGEPLRWQPRRPRMESTSDDGGAGAVGVEVESPSSSSSWVPLDASSSNDKSPSSSPCTSHDLVDRAMVLGPSPPPSSSSSEVPSPSAHDKSAQHQGGWRIHDGGGGIFLDGTTGRGKPSPGGSSSAFKSGTAARDAGGDPAKARPRNVSWSHDKGSAATLPPTLPPPPVSSSILRGSMCIRIGNGGGLGSDVTATTPPPPSRHYHCRHYHSAVGTDAGPAESRRVKYARMSSIVSSGYALIDSLPQTTEEEEERRRWKGSLSEVDEGGIADTADATAAAWAGASPSSMRSHDGSDGPLHSSSGAAASRHRHHLHHRRRPHEAVEPFISSLAKSVEILMKHSSSHAVHASALGGDGGKDNLMAHFDEEDKERGGGRRRRRKLRGPPSFSFLHLPTKARLVTILHLSAFSVLGEALRVFLGRLFGGECRDGDTPWLLTVVTAANVCVTSDGSGISPGLGTTGGAIFTDLPANMFGSFLMGLAQPTRDLGLLADVPVSVLPYRHWFQSWTVVHLGFRTGFCGALTTLASWNAQMVAMIASPSQTQFFSAAFGYVIGLEVAMASFRLGRDAAVWLHRFSNPRLAREEDVLMFAYTRTDGGDGGASGASSSSSDVVEKALPDYERRYLRSLLPREQRLWAEQNLSALEDLERWKISTDRYRAREAVDPAHGSYDVLVALHEIERKVLVDDEEELGDDLVRIAERLGWDVESLSRFAREANVALHSSSTSAGENDVSSSPSLVVQNVMMSIPSVLAVALLVGFAVLERSTAESEFYRRMWLSALLAPFGTVLRWKLSSLNGGGAVGSRWMWFPLGTFTANIVASAISALTEGLMDSPFEFDMATEQMLSAIKTGFAGSMSTVSTFVAEGCMLQTSFPHHAKAYYYMVGTLMSACVAGLIIYSPIVRSG